MNEYHDKYFDQQSQKTKGDIETKEQFKPLSLVELMMKKFPDTEWIVQKLVPSGSIIAVSGPPTALKTWLMLDLATKVSQGEILFDKFATTQASVLIVDEDNGLRLLQKRVNKLTKQYDLPIYILSYSGFKLRDEDVKCVISFCKDRHVKLVIFDALIRIHTQDENDASKMTQVFGILRRFTKEEITVVFTHHHRKQGMMRSNPSQDMRGSSDILASVDCHIAVERKAKEGYLVINQTKLRQEEEAPPFKLTVIDDGEEMKFEFAGDVDEAQSRKADFRGAIHELLEREGRPMYKTEVYCALKEMKLEGAHSTFKSAVDEMLKGGELFGKKGEKNKVFISLTPFE